MWYSSELLSRTKKKSFNDSSSYEQASQPRELLLHKSRSSELQARRINNCIKNPGSEIFDKEVHNTRNTKKPTKFLLITFVSVITIIVISGQHFLLEKISSVPEVLKLINVEAFEAYSNKTDGENEKNLKDIQNKIKVNALKPKATPNPKFSRSLVLLDLEDWRKNWSSRNLNVFMGYYHVNFPDLEIFKKNKKRIFKKARYINIDLKNIASRVEGDDIVTSFTQIYKSKNYNDTSVKELTWAKTKTGWKIIGEKNINSNVAKKEKK